MLLVYGLGVIVALGHYLLAAAFVDGRTVGAYALFLKAVRTSGTRGTVDGRSPGTSFESST